MDLNLSKFYFSILLICVLTLSLGSVFAVSNDDVIDVAEIDYSVSDSNFVVDYNGGTDGDSVKENGTAFSNSFRDDVAGDSVNENGTAFGNFSGGDGSLFVFNQNGTNQTENFSSILNNDGKSLMNFTNFDSIKDDLIADNISSIDLSPLDDVIANEDFNSINAPMKANSNKISTFIYAQNMNKSFDDVDKKFRVTLISEDNQKLASKEILFSVIYENGHILEYTKITDSLGEAFLTINLNPGTYILNLSFKGDSSYSASSRTNRVIINQSKTYIFSNDLIDLKSTSNKKFLVKLTDSNFKPLMNQTITITLNYNNYSRVTDSEGIASLNINLGFGTTIFKVKFSGNAKYSSSNISNKVQIASYVFSEDEIFEASKTIKDYVEKNHKLPNTVTIRSVNLNMAQYFALAGELIINPNQTVAPLLKNTYQNAPSPSENTSGGILNSTEYTNIFNRMLQFTYSNDKTPNYDVSSLEKVSINSYVYLASCILYSRSVNLNNPYFVTLIPWKDITNSNTKFFSQFDVLNASKRLADYVEKNHKLPSTLSVNGTQVKMAPLLKMLSTAIIDIEGDYFSSVPYKNFDAAPNPSETINYNYLNESSYLIYAVDVNHFMDIMKYAPNWLTTDFGNIRFENTLYLFSQILSYYYDNDFMPDKVVVYPWNTVSKNTTKVYTNNEIISSAVSLKNYIIQNHKVPDKVLISGKNVDIDAFLQLACEAILNINYDLCSNSIVKSISKINANNTESVKNVYLSKENYIKAIIRLNDYILQNKRTLSKLTMNLTHDKDGEINKSNIVFGKNSLIYLVSDILSSYNSTNRLPDKIEFSSWNDLTKSGALIFSKDEIKNSANQLINQVNANHNIPNLISISGKNINKIDFLDLLINTVYKLDNNYISSSLVRNLSNYESVDENLVSGSFDYSEYMRILDNIRFNITKPHFNGSNSSLGHLGINSLIYMYSKVLVGYVNDSLPEDYVLVPWIAKSNPNKIYNYNSKKVFSNLNSAITDNTTKDGDTIGVGISKNNIGVINLNKVLNFIPLPGIDVSLVNGTQNSKITFNKGSSGSYLVDFNILNVGLYLNNVSNICIYYSNISAALKTAINIYNSSDNEIIGNNIYNSNIGIFIDTGSADNDISNNLIHENTYGTKLKNCLNNSIGGNLIENNNYGVYAENSSFDLEYNGISNNTHDLYDFGDKVSNLNNNWWGINNPRISSTNSNEKIYSKKNFNMAYLILVVDSFNFYDNSTNNDYLKLIKASFKNNKNDNIDLENFPLMPIEFETNKGSLNQSNYMISGIGTAILTGSFNTSSNIKLSVSNQVINFQINFNKFDNPVINSRNNKAYKNIQSAINDVNTIDGDCLKLKAGAYLENVCIFKKIRLISFGDGEVLILPKNDSISSTIIISNDNVSINNLSIYGTVSTDAIFSIGNSFKLTNSKIYNSFTGVYLYDVGNAILSNNSILGCSYGLYLDGSDNCSFVNNTIFNNDYGIISKYSTINLFKNNCLFNNWMAIEDSSKYNQFLSNNIHDNYQGIRLIASSSAVLDSNNVYNNYLGLLKYSSSFTNKSSSVYNNSLIDVQSLNDGEIVIQDNMWYCGPAALSIIFENLGLTVSQKDIASIAGTNANGTSLYGLYQACIHYGFNSTAWKLAYDNLRINDLVALLFDGEYHFSVVYGINETTIILNDPSIGLFELDKETFNEFFSGYVLDLEYTKNRGVKLSAAQMKSVVGTNPLFVAGAFLAPEAFAIGAVVIGAAYTGWKIGEYAGRYYNSWKKHKSHYSRHKVRHYKNPKGHYYSSYPSYRGNKGNRVKSVSSSFITYSFGNKKYYAKGHAYLSKSSLNKLGVSSSKLAEIAYQESYNYYLSTKEKERAKLTKSNDIIMGSVFKKKFNKNKDFKLLMGPEGNESLFLKQLVKYSGVNYKKGTSLIKEGHTLKGLVYIGAAISMVSLGISYVLMSLFPKDFFRFKDGG